ncbi:MAG TPA: hypothetical protein VKS79_17725 [Gemmataceae bacterium]|nr:hypothetical protein [Gemmataceae bacterium]
MSGDFDSSDSLIVEFEGPSDPITNKPLPLKLFMQFLERRQRYIEAGLIPDVPLPPEAYPPDYPHENPPDSKKGRPKS